MRGKIVEVINCCRVLESATGSHALVFWSANLSQESSIPRSPDDALIFFYCYTGFRAYSCPVGAHVCYSDGMGG